MAVGLLSMERLDCEILNMFIMIYFEIFWTIKSFYVILIILDPSKKMLLMCLFLMFYKFYSIRARENRSFKYNK